MQAIEVGELFPCFHCLMHLASPKPIMKRTQNHAICYHATTYMYVLYILYVYLICCICMPYNPICIPYMLYMYALYFMCMPYIYYVHALLCFIFLVKILKYSRCVTFKMHFMIGECKGKHCLHEKATVRNTKGVCLCRYGTATIR